jgi:nicotinamide riboside kinase
MIWVLTGPESSGKTTLAQALSERLRWPVLPELARGYLTQRAMDTGQEPYRYRPSDLIALVRAQQVLEAPVDETEHCILDTDLLTLTTWWQEKYGPVPALFNEAWSSQLPRFHLLCRPDLPWEMDPLRENPQDRERLFGLYEQQLRRRGCQYAICDGAGTSRAENALAIIRQARETQN